MKQADGSYGIVSIYDAVGNQLARDIKLKRATKSNNYGFIWDGKNKKGRDVGKGTYLAVVRCKDMDEKSYVVKVMLGVK